MHGFATCRSDSPEERVVKYEEPIASLRATVPPAAPCHAFLTKPISLTRHGAEIDKSLSELIAIKIPSKPGETIKRAEAIYS